MAMENHEDKESSVPEKPTRTIHECAQSGDIDGLKKLLEDNPSLVNERDALMSETPLHVCSSNNKTEIVKFLLEWKGNDKIDLEAENVYGETPLHLAAKNGNHEAARLLLAHGALVEAETKYGVTPLHLSVWYSIRAEDCSIVETLLENNADCNAKDDEGMTPLDRLTKSQESGKLRELLFSRQEEQRKKKGLEACSKEKAKMEEFEKELSNIVGLDELKTQLRTWARGILVDERRRALGLKVGKRKLPHMAFLGNPGTGKTMVARVLGKLLHSVGILPTDKVKEVQRTDLVGQYIGHTGPLTRKKIKEAEGGILFVDEAYRLVPSDACSRDFGREALEEIMSFMDSGKVLVVFAGYYEPMKRVISSNEGFIRRVTNIFNFKDLTCEELANIVHIKMKNQAEDKLLHGFKLHPSCTVEAIAELIKEKTTETQRMKMNGGLVDIMMDNAKGNLDLRMGYDCLETDELLSIKLEDFEAALKFLPQ